MKFEVFKKIVDTIISEISIIATNLDKLLNTAFDKVNDHTYTWSDADRLYQLDPFPSDDIKLYFSKSIVTKEELNTIFTFIEYINAQFDLNDSYYNNISISSLYSPLRYVEFEQFLIRTTDIASKSDVSEIYTLALNEIESPGTKYNLKYIGVMLLLKVLVSEYLNHLVEIDLPYSTFKDSTSEEIYNKFTYASLNFPSKLVYTYKHYSLYVKDQNIITLQDSDVLKSYFNSKEADDLISCVCDIVQYRGEEYLAKTSQYIFKYILKNHEVLNNISPDTTIPSTFFENAIYTLDEWIFILENFKEMSINTRKFLKRNPHISNEDKADLMFLL